MFYHVIKYVLRKLVKKSCDLSFLSDASEKSSAGARTFSLPFCIILGQSLRFQTKPNIPFLNVTLDLGLETLVFGAAVAEPHWLCPLGVILVWRMSRPVSLLIGQFLHPLALSWGQNSS